MKVLYIIDSLSKGGKERQLIGLFKEILKNKDVDPYLVILSDKIEYVEFADLNIKYSVLKKNKFFDFKLFKGLISEVKKIDPEIIHTWEWYSSLAILPAKIICNKKMINGNIRYGYKARIFSKAWLYALFLFPFSKIVIANSLSGLKAHGKRVSNKYRVIYNGFDLQRLKSNISFDKDMFPNIPSNSIIVGMVARFNAPKDYFTILKAIDMLQKKYQNLFFIMVGDGDDRKRAEKTIEYLRDKEKYIFTGKRNDVENIVNLFDIAVLTCNTNGYAEGLSNSIMEYMACKKPVIATKSGGNNELVEDNTTGFLVYPFNVKDLSEKLIILIEDASLRKRFGEKGYEKIKNNFSEAKMYENYINLYEEVLK